MGDLRGVRSHLDHLEELGVDALWLSPFYPSPQADAGYDVSDHREVDPAFATLADFDALVADAHARGLRVIVDLVPNHTSSEHRWFRAALDSPPGSPERRRHVLRRGKGPGGSFPPNNWQSDFGGSAWTRVEDGTAEPQWYLHLFDPGQPDLNWRNREVLHAFHDILRFWLRRGVDGFRVDVARGLVKDESLRGINEQEREKGMGPMWDQPGVHEIHRGWRRGARVESTSRRGAGLHQRHRPGDPQHVHRACHAAKGYGPARQPGRRLGGRDASTESGPVVVNSGVKLPPSCALLILRSQIPAAGAQ